MTTRELNPKFPPPDPNRVALLMALDWDKPLHDGHTFLGKATINGRPITAAERTTLGECTVNDLAAMRNLADEELRIANERLAMGNRANEILDRYGFYNHSSIGATIGQVRSQMSAQDGAEFDRLADVLWPDGYMWLTDTV